jgi:hypothetical protein
MSAISFRRFIPTFIPLIIELLRHFRRDAVHNNKIKKFDKTEEKLSSVEHLLVRMEKKLQQQRDDVQKTHSHLYWWLALNSALLVAILLKLLFFMQ